MSRKFNAILGLGALAAFGFASSAFAQCPTGPVPPWTAAPVFQGTSAIIAGGLGGTTCHLNSTINAGASGAAFATVQDTTPADEPRYRAQFIINADALTSQQLLQGVNVFTANSTAAFGGVGAVVRLSIFGGGTRQLSFFTVDEGQPGNVRSGVTALAAGENIVEVEWQAGDGDGYFKMWVNNSTEATPTVQRLDLNNDGWVGVNEIFLGLAAPTNQFVAGQSGRAVSFDEFDSRRTSFIGN